jgi:hydroxypyruvate isomerase
MFNLAVCAEMVFLDLPFEERVRRIAESGFQVEIWNWTRHDIDALVGTGAEFSSMVGHTAGSLPDEDGANALLRGAEESLAVAERLGCRRLLVFGTELGPDGVPLRPVHQVTGAMWLNAYKTLSRLAELAERAGVTFCLENLNTTLDHPGAPFARANDTLALVEAVARPGLRMMLDLYHAQIGEGNLIQLLKRADSLIGEVQVADVPGRCEPGTGEINFAAIAAALKDMGYRGTVGLEAYASGDDKVALERFSAVFGAGTPVQQQPAEPTATGVPSSAER